MEREFTVRNRRACLLRGRLSNEDRALPLIMNNLSTIITGKSVSLRDRKVFKVRDKIVYLQKEQVSDYINMKFYFK